MGIVRCQILVRLTIPDAHQAALGMGDIAEGAQRQTLFVGCAAWIEPSTMVYPCLFAEERADALRMNTGRAAVFVQLEEILQFDLQKEMNGRHTTMVIFVPAVRLLRVDCVPSSGIRSRIRSNDGWNLWIAASSDP